MSDNNLLDVFRKLFLKYKLYKEGYFLDPYWYCFFLALDIRPINVISFCKTKNKQLQNFHFSSTELIISAN